MSGAYSGNSVPSGVAADGYYAKGSSRVARLFEILTAIADESTRRSTRAIAPIWIPGLSTVRPSLRDRAEVSRRSSPGQGESLHSSFALPYPDVS
jgi:hypothetical protein